MPKARPAGSLLEEVQANLPTRVRRTFASSLPADLLAELETIRADWQAGRLGDVTKTGLGKAVAAALAGRGLKYHTLTVVRWLEER
jgi:hypothetical protein